MARNTSRHRRLPLSKLTLLVCIIGLVAFPAAGAVRMATHSHITFVGVRDDRYLVRLEIRHGSPTTSTYVEESLYEVRRKDDDTVVETHVIQQILYRYETDGLTKTLLHDGYGNPIVESEWTPLAPYTGDLVRVRDRDPDVVLEVRPNESTAWPGLVYVIDYREGGVYAPSPIRRFELYTDGDYLYVLKRGEAGGVELEQRDGIEAIAWSALR